MDLPDRFDDLVVPVPLAECTAKSQPSVGGDNASKGLFEATKCSRNLRQIRAALSEPHRHARDDGPDTAKARETPPPIVICQVARVTARSDDKAPIPRSCVVVDHLYSLGNGPVLISRGEGGRPMAPAIQAAVTVRAADGRIAADPCRRDRSRSAIGKRRRGGVACRNSRENGAGAVDRQPTNR